MSVVTGKTKPLLVPYIAVSSNIYTVPVDLGIIRASPSANAAWTLPSLSLLKNGAFLWIDNQTGFTITLQPTSPDLVNGASSFIISNNNFCTIYTGTQWNASSYVIPPTGASTDTRYGTQALASITTGFNRTAVGFQSLNLNTSGINNSAFGARSLRNNTTGGNNSAFGNSALTASTTANSNCAFGSDSLLSCTTGAQNCAFGQGSLSSSTTQTGNSAFGTLSLFGCVASSNNAFGSQTAVSLTTGTRNCCFGNSSLGLAVTSNDCSGFGFQTLASTTGSNNSAFGSGALTLATTGSGLTAIGQGSMPLVTTGGNNTSLGFNSLPVLTTGSNNIAIGQSSGSVLTTGSGNIHLGASAITAAESNTIRIGTLGSQTVTYLAGGNPVTSESAPSAAGIVITAADLANGIVIINGASTITATGALIDAQFTGIQTGNVIKVLVVNTQGAASTITTVAAGITLTNAISIAQNDTRLLYFRRTGTAAYTVY